MFVTYPDACWYPDLETRPTPNFSQPSTSETTRVGFLFRTWARPPTLRTAGLRADERAKFGIAGLHAHGKGPPNNEHAECLCFCVNIPEVPTRLKCGEHIDTLE